MAAQEQKIEFLFAAQVSGQAQLFKLTESVDALRKEMEALKAANGGVGASMAGFSKSVGNASSHVQAYQKHLDAQAKSMRNHRMGTQQLGMQFNDLGTSISTGASPIQAFNQQLGQMGYAMSMMSGKMGAVGSFLAGPWGAAIVVATMILGPLIEELLNTGNAAKKAAEEAENLKKHERALVEIAGELVVARARIDEAMGKNVDSYLVGQRVAIDLARIDIESAKESIRAANMRLVAARANMAANKTLQAIGTSNSGVGLIGIIREYFQDNEGKIKKENDDLKAIEVAMRKLEVNMTGRRADMLERKNDENEKNAKKGIAAAKRVAAEAKRIAKEAEAAREKEAKSIEDFMGKIGKVGIKELPAFQRQIADLEKDFMELSKAGQAATIAPFKAAVESIEMAQYSDVLKESAKDADKMLKDTLSDFKPPAVSLEMDAIISKSEEMDKSFEAIGTTISNSFKGILTGAMSFKDAMKGIISAVIDELFRLFVVQQIVGIVSGALGGLKPGGASGGAFGSSTGNFLPGVPRNAYGGSVMGNRPTLVGERGPELFVPGGNGTIIPNSNMRGGGGGSSFNISVDARGSNDPAAVRAQVMQGILETAPAIIAAAESRTISNLRRPRLGGAMQ